MECWAVEGAGTKLLFSAAAELFTAEAESGVGDVGEIEYVVGSGRLLVVELSSAPS